MSTETRDAVDFAAAPHAAPAVADQEWLLTGLSDPGAVGDMVALGSTSPPNCCTWVNFC